MPPFTAYVTACLRGSDSPTRYKGEGAKKKEAKANAYYNAWMWLCGESSVAYSSPASVAHGAAATDNRFPPPSPSPFSLTPTASPSTTTRQLRQSPLGNHRQNLERYCREHGAAPPTLEEPTGFMPPFTAYVTACLRGSDSPTRYKGEGAKKKEAKANAYYNAWMKMCGESSAVYSSPASAAHGAAATDTRSPSPSPPPPLSPSTPSASPSTTTRQLNRQSPLGNHRQNLERYCRENGAAPPTLEEPTGSMPPFTAYVTACLRGSGNPTRYKGEGAKKKEAKANAYYNAWVGTCQKL